MVRACACWLARQEDGMPEIVQCGARSAVRAELTATRAAVVEHLNRARAIALTLELGVDGGAEADAGL
jgi:hypothetical protein